MYRSECNDNDKRTLQNSASSGLRSVSDQQVSNLKNQFLLANNIYTNVLTICLIKYNLIKFVHELFH